MQDICGELLRRHFPHSLNSLSFYGLRGETSRQGFINSHVVTQRDAFLRMMLIPYMVEQGHGQLKN